MTSCLSPAYLSLGAGSLQLDNLLDQRLRVRHHRRPHGRHGHALAVAALQPDNRRWRLMDLAPVDVQQLGRGCCRSRLGRGRGLSRQGRGRLEMAGDGALGRGPGLVEAAAAAGPAAERGGRDLPSTAILVHLLQSSLAARQLSGQLSLCRLVAAFQDLNLVVGINSLDESRY